jgi:hypothetical protein
VRSDLGDDANSESIGTLVAVKQGELTIIVQGLTADVDEQLSRATALAEAVLAGL